MILFAAVLPPPAVVAEIAAAVERSPRAERLRWSDPRDWHLTLAYYGPTSPEALGPLRERLAASAAATDPFVLALRGAGRFGDRVLWLGLGAGEPEITALAAAARAVGPGVAAHGAPGEDRRFTPHLTLARAGRPATPLAPLEAALADVAPPPWRVRRLVLLTAPPPGTAPQPGSPRYTALASWPLGGPATAPATPPG
ncbi:RNA 2',3'-cyclic phosphodiesterase [Streptomyces bohaiensis]|uniref:RNA 2',3'-cyclic phosphodiesterase n=1 Tax=Streptomyces bohaiensis TaxID=1431344 RepID=A0ABX1CEY2_9ACTN|nr:RNA 2',3'-cyclic phosphodiesterase [Streptomyces bohaiensis]NJQ15774.1 RNA 2',3'-cyclic phosphodiesterase [Streptomyces bohaiensis]